MEMYRVLIVDDDVAVTNYLMVFLMQTETYESAVINDSRDVPGVLERESFDAILLDMDMPNISGLDILKLVHDRQLNIPTIVLTGVADVELAVNAMKLGAFDYLTKPVDDEHLLEVLANAIEHKSLHHSIKQLPSELSRKDLTYEAAFEHVPTQNPQMIRLFHLAEKMASSDLSIFIWGKRGTGKQSLARAIHNASPRRNEPFVFVDAAAIAPTLFPANFFGQAKDWSGAREARCGFLEEAAGGTLFLDEIDCLKMPMQMRLIRVIQTGEFYREGSTRIQKIDVRFIVASNHDLTSEEYKDSFSRDLLYHLMINSIRIPPLRERIDDIPLLAELFLEQENKKLEKKVTGFAPEFIELLKNYSFPDNLQELRNIIASALVNEESSIITVDSLSPYLRDMLTGKAAWTVGEFRPRALKEIEQEHVRKMLEYYGFNREKAAKELGIAAQELERILAGENSPEGKKS